MSTSGDYVGLGPCVQDPAWVKMSSPTPALQKKRKKPDSKPQTQINKCLNEKRRREQENTYIEELAELIQASIVSDMNSLSVKPDKCAILQQTVDKIKQIKESEASNRAVQQGEVSSSRQTLLQNQVLGPLVLEALDGFLFLVSTEGKIEFVSENVSQYIKFAPEDLSGKVIYNIIHVGDHTKFSSPFMSVGWPSETTTSSGTTSTTASSECSRSRSFICRLLVKPPDDPEETVEEKQQRVSQYEPMQISAVLSSNYLGDKSDSEDLCGERDNQKYLVCIARRIPTNEPQATPVEQFTTKLDSQGHIIDIDISGISSIYSQYLTKDLVRKNFGDICHPADFKKFSSLLRESLHLGHSTSQVYRLKFAPDRFIHIQTKCKYFQNSQEESFIMATHSILSSSFQDGSSGSNSLTSPANTGDMIDEKVPSVIGQSGTTQDTANATASDSSRQLRLLLTQVNDSDLEGDMSGGGVEGGGGGGQQQNKILKGLLDQKDEEDASPSPNSLLNRLCTPVSHSQVQQQQSQTNHHVNHLQDGMKNNNNNNTGNNMLRELLNDKSDDDDDLRIKKEKDTFFFDILAEDSKEEPPQQKVVIKQEFRTGVSSAAAAAPSLTPSSSSPSTASPFSLPNTSSTSSFGYSSSVVAGRPPSRPSSTDLQSIRGIKRPSDEAHDGNPSKQTVGGFESLLVGSPPTAVMSPVSGPHGGPATPLARPNTPHGRPNTPHGRPNTPHGRPNTPHGRPNTPHSGPLTPHGAPGTPHGPATPHGPPTPHGPSTPLGVGTNNIGGPNTQGMNPACSIGGLSIGPVSSMSPNLSTSTVTQQQIHHPQLQQQHLHHHHHQQQQQQQQQLQQHHQQMQSQHQQHQQQLQQQQQQQQQQQNSKHEKNKMLLKLLQTQTVQQQQNTSTGLKPITSPFSLPQEKLPKNLNEKLNICRTWASASSTNTSSVATSSVTNSQSSEILNQLLRQPPNSTKPSHKIGPSQLLRQTSHPSQESISTQNSYHQQQQHEQQQLHMHMQQQQQQQQQQPQIQQPQLSMAGHLQSHPQLPSGNTQNNLGLTANVSMNSNTVGVTVTASGMANQPGIMSNMSPLTSVNCSSGNLTNSPVASTNSATTLPPFSHSMGVNIFGSVTDSYSDGPLPSITSATSSFSQDPLNNDLHDIVMQVLLDLEMSNSGENSGLNSLLDDFQHNPSSSSSPVDVNENFAIQQIKKKLMSEEFETQSSSPTMSGSMTSLSSFSSGGSPASSMSSFPPAYSQKSRYPNSGPQGVVSVANPHLGNPSMAAVGSNAVIRQAVPQFSPGSPVMQSRPLPGQQRLTQQEQMKARLLQRQQHQVLVPSSSSDSSQSTSPAYQNFDDLINSSVAPNVNVALQRNPSDPQSSPNYGMMNSPIGSGGGGQVSPGQRIPQPPFSPHGQIASPLSNTPQYTNNSGINQMASYQNSQSSQLSPRLSQGSPAPPSYPTGGALLPQVSPTGHNPGVQVPQGQQSPAWSGSSPQHRSTLQQQHQQQQQQQQQQQNPMLNNQLGMLGAGNRSFAGGGRTIQLPSIRSLPNAGPRQSHYSIGGSQPSGSPDLSAFATSPQQGPPSLLYQQQQQQQQQYRLTRATSAPGQMPGTSGMINDRTKKELRARFERNTAVSGVGGASSPSLAQHHQQQPQMQQQQQQQSVTQQQQRSQMSQQQQLSQLQQQQQRQQGASAPQTQQQQQAVSQAGGQQQSNFQPLDHHHHQHHLLDQSILHSYSPSGDGSSWGRDSLPQGGTPQGASGTMNPSARMDDNRAAVGTGAGGGAGGGGGGEKEKSMLKKLLSQ